MRQVNAETGELREEWVPETLTDAEWVLEKILEHRSEIAALEQRKAAIVANLDSMIKEQERAIEGLKYKYEPALEAIARRELEGKKAKHVKSPYGRFGFRKLPDRLELTVTPDEAVAWAKENAPQIVIVNERVNKTDLARVGAPFVQEIEGETQFYIDVSPPSNQEE